MNGSKTYKTKQKSEILDYLIEHKGEHFTVDELAIRLSNHGVNVGKTTVYRHLEKLTDTMQVRKYETGKNSAACYEYYTDKKDGECRSHYHLKCTVCGKLFHLECSVLSTVNEHIFKEHGFSVNSVRTVFYGVCAECGEKDKKETEKL